LFVNWMISYMLAAVDKQLEGSRLRLSK